MALKAKASPPGNSEEDAKDKGADDSLEMDSGGDAGLPGLEALPEAVQWLEGVSADAPPDVAAKIKQAVEILKGVGGGSPEAPPPAPDMGAGEGIGAGQ